MASCRTRLFLVLVAVPFLVVLGWYHSAYNLYNSRFAAAGRDDDGPFAFLRDPSFIFTLVTRIQRRQNTANGPVWARALQRSYSHAMLVNFAISGATIDNILCTWDTSILDVRNQIAAFLAWFAPPPSRARWGSGSALFALGIGTNDVMITTTKPSVRMKGLNQSAADAHAEMLQYLFIAVKQLYKAGARAFLFQTLGPYDRSMAGVELGPEKQEELRKNILLYNDALTRSANVFCAKYADTFCLVHDTYNLTVDVMENYARYGFKEPVKFCPEYKLNPTSEASDETLPGCVGPSGAYVWRDRLHPSWQFHSIWAQDVRTEINKRLDGLALQAARETQTQKQY
ncbi:hypothetical protein AURDEDRAFT_149211 [Auricularia subglabra TFB-10046 SS5]|nr:hypothetical protein AURDEDRAFT_149211 [Auricularia subglabra TFB-10046 SS5]